MAQLSQEGLQEREPALHRGRAPAALRDQSSPRPHVRRGGFASRARLHYQYLSPEQATPSFDRYAEAICDTIIHAWPAGRPLPKLYLETGRALVDETGYLISAVVAVKRRPTVTSLPGVLAAYGKAAPATLRATTGSETDRPALVIDAGVNLLYTSTWYAPSILPAKACADVPAPTTVYGCLCMNIDVIQEETPLPGLTHRAPWNWALDFEIIPKDRRNSGSGENFEDYHTYQKLVLAPCSGTVAAVRSHVHDNIPGANNPEENWGNYIVIYNEAGYYVLLAHLRQDSSLVYVGQRIVSGEPIGSCGNSGRSPVPHLHLQVQYAAYPGGETRPFCLRNFVEVAQAGVPQNYITAGTPDQGARVPCPRRSPPSSATGCPANTVTASSSMIALCARKRCCSISTYWAASASVPAVTARN